jgi:methionine synthase I (cobalamin-dependent)/5,10-methylenetetrahydrofolate reductase
MNEDPATLSGPRAAFRQRLAAGPLLADGAMGTLLFARGVPQRACLDELVLTRPGLVTAIHREYLAAGAELIETATFGANRLRLAAWGLEGAAGRIARRGAQLAREAREVAGHPAALIAGSVGPLGPPTRQLAETDEATIRSAFQEQVDGLLEGGVDLFFVETFSFLDHLLAAVEVIRASCDLPVVAQLTFGEELVAPDGTTPEAAAAALRAAGVDALGVNCGAGPAACLSALERMGGEGPVFRSILPNAGLPQRLEGEFVWSASPAYLGAMVPRFLAAGARIVGGCCGTTPEHIRAMARGLEEAAGTTVAPADRPPTEASAPLTGGPVELPSSGPSLVVAGGRRAGSLPAEGAPTEERSGLARRLAAGEFVISVEIDPPRSIRLDRTLAAARTIQLAGADLVNVSDSAMARVRMGALAVAVAIQSQVGLETLIHVTTRDRNLMALESELLGAHALGIRNVLALTGDPPRIGDYPGSSGVWDVDSIGLIEILARLNRGEDQAGSPIGQPATFTIACALDPTAADPDTEWARLERKLAAGAQLVMTQPLYAVDQVEAMFDRARRQFGPRGFPVPVLLGVLPLVSARHAEFLHHEVPGITIPDAVRRAMHQAGEAGSEMGTRLALELLDAVGPLVDGVYVMPSFGRYEQAAALVRELRERSWARARREPGQQRAATGGP